MALKTSYDAMRLELDRIVRQRNTLLKQAGGRLTDEVGSRSTCGMPVWPSSASSSAMPGRRWSPGASRWSPRRTSNSPVRRRRSSWSTNPSGVGRVWRRTRRVAGDSIVRRGVSTVGPHRDEVAIGLNGLPARTHASQGEQRTLALALRLAAHRLVAERTGSTPVLVLDDVLSELDPDRATALLANLPPGQVVITSALPLPPAAEPERIIQIERVRSSGDCSPMHRSPMTRFRSRVRSTVWSGRCAARAARRSAGCSVVGTRRSVSRSPSTSPRSSSTRAVLVVEVDDPAWATQVKFLTPMITERLFEVAEVRVDRIDVRVERRGARGARLTSDRHPPG